MNSLVIVLVIALLAIYLIVRQFTEQVVNWRSLLLLPLAAAYGCYTELQPDFAHFALAPLLASLVVGIVPGLFTGLFRGKHTRVRLDSTRGSIVSKPELASSLTWLGLLIIHIAAIAVSYIVLEHNVLGGMLTAFVASFLLVNVIVQKFIVYQQYSRYQSNMPQRFV